MEVSTSVAIVTAVYEGPRMNRYSLYLQFCRAYEKTKDISKLAQIFQNYDYVPGSESGPGSSVYRAMDDGKVKSVTE